MAAKAAEKDVSSGRHTLAWGVALLLWAAFIWGHSLIGGVASSAESGRVVALMRPLFEAVGVRDVDLMTFVVRKLAHFSEYAVLGVIACAFWRRVAEGRAAGTASGIDARRRALLAGALLTCAVPCLDEAIQLFVPGRCGSVRDVLIDLSGVAVGALISWLVLKRETRRR